MRSFATYSGLPSAWAIWWAVTWSSSGRGDGRPPLPLPARPRAIVHAQASARHAGTSRLVLQPATGATPTSLPLIKPTVSLHFLLEQCTDGDRLAAIHAGQCLQACRVGHRAFDRHGLHAVSQQPDGAGDPVGDVADFRAVVGMVIQ